MRDEHKLIVILPYWKVWKERELIKSMEGVVGVYRAAGIRMTVLFFPVHLDGLAFDRL